MVKEEKATDFWEEVANLDEIPAGVIFNQAEVWAKLEAKLEADRRTRNARRILLITIIAIVIVLSLAIWFRSTGKVQPPKKLPSSFGAVVSFNQNQTI